MVYIILTVIFIPLIILAFMLPDTDSEYWDKEMDKILNELKRKGKL